MASFTPFSKLALLHFQYLGIIQADGVAWAVHVNVLRHLRGGGTWSRVFYESVLKDLLVSPVYSHPSHLMLYTTRILLLCLVFVPDENLPYCVIWFIEHVSITIL